MVVMMDAPEEHTREGLMELMRKKNDIEREIASLKDILDSNSVGLSDSLVDGDGYPRDDIDVYAVRHARHLIICLQNDHKNVMREIQVGYDYFVNTCRGMSQMDLVDEPIQLPTPITKVTSVSPESPAFTAGLQVGDLIAKFGSVNEENYTSVQDINNVVKYSVGRAISLTVLRNGTIKRLSVTPKRGDAWGLLGCHIVPIDAIDR